MKRILVKSVHDAFEYVMQHYYLFRLEEFAERTVLYAVISIQATHTDGFGFVFTENQFCKGILTLYFDDIMREVEGTILFTDGMAEQIMNFIGEHKNVDTSLRSLLVPSGFRGINAFEKWMPLPEESVGYGELFLGNSILSRTCEELFNFSKEKA